MTAAAIYARFSSDLQDDRSIDDQVAACTAYAGRIGYTIVTVYEDRAMSGATFAARAGLQRMLADLPRQAFAAVITESLSRISRDQADTHAIGKELDYHDVKLITIGDGEVTGMVRGLRAIINEQQLADIKLMTRRGLAGRIAEGRSAGGVQYGYDVVAGAERGHRTINQAEAAIVRRIFVRYLEGASPRAIAAELNADGVPAPRGRRWRANSIIGNGRRGTGILQNELYAGGLVWNRVRMVRNPKTRRRVSRPNPEDEWKRHPVPELAIIERSIWEAAQAHKEGRGQAPRRQWTRPVRMLTGLLRCGACGDGMPSVGKDRAGLRVQCAGVRESGCCDNRRRYYLAPIERAVAGGLRRQFGSAEAIAHFVACYEDELARATTADPRPQLERRMAAIDADLARAVDLTLRGVIAEAEAAPRLKALRTERSHLAQQLKVAGASSRRIDGRARDRWLSALDHLETFYGEHIADDDVAATLRALLDTVIVAPAPAGTLPTITITGHLDALLCPEENPLPCRGGAVVAGEALGMTHRLPFVLDIAA
jgi:site-specific DNA recombinase